jgi:hypothetical protein
VFDARARDDFLRAYCGEEVNERRLSRLASAVERKRRRLRAYAERKLARGDPNIHVNV